MLRIFAVAALPIISFAQERSIEDLTDEEIVAMELNCGKQTSDAAQCLTPCFQEAQECFRTVGTAIADIQDCMLDKPVATRSNYCNSCIAQQVAEGCEWWFNYQRSQNNPDTAPTEFQLEEFWSFKRMCSSLTGGKVTCVDSGCHYNRKGCTAKPGKVACGRIKVEAICDGVPGCRQRKKVSPKGKICKGTPTWEIPEKRNANKNPNKQG